MVKSDALKAPPPSKIEDEDVALTPGFLVKAVDDSGHDGIVDDTEDVEASVRRRPW